MFVLVSTAAVILAFSFLKKKKEKKGQTKLKGRGRQVAIATLHTIQQSQHSVEEEERGARHYLAA